MTLPASVQFILALLLLLAAISKIPSLEVLPAASAPSLVGFIANRIDLQVDGSITVQSPYGSLRGDAQGVCGDTNNGFSYLVNWSGDLGPGQRIHWLRSPMDWNSLGQRLPFLRLGYRLLLEQAARIPCRLMEATSLCNGKSHCKILLFGE